MSGMIKPSFCSDRFSKLIKAVHDWKLNDSSDILVPWMRDRVKGFSQSVAIAFETFFDATADAESDVEPWFQRLVAEGIHFVARLGEESRLSQ